MKLLVINNLTSGYGEGAVYDFVRLVARDGDEVCLRSTDGTTDICALMTDATKFDAVVASGGDGTVATVCHQLANTGIPVLPFPAGTANLLALNLMSPNEPHALAKILRHGTTLDFDLGEVEIEGKKFGFSLMAGGGYDATIMEKAKPHKRLLGPLAYFSAAATNIAPRTSKLTITLDGERTVETEGLCVLAINFSKIQFDISVTHGNHPRDGRLDIAILKGQTALDLIPAVWAAFLDRGGEFPGRTDSVEFHSCTEAHVVADPPMEVQYDGEAIRLTTPFTVRVLPGAARIIVSDEGYKMFL